MKTPDYKWIIDSQYNIRITPDCKWNINTPNGIIDMPVCRTITGVRRNKKSEMFIFCAVNCGAGNTNYTFAYPNAVSGTKYLYFNANLHLTKVETQERKYISESYLRRYVPLTDYIREHLLPFLVV